MYGYTQWFCKWSTYCFVNITLASMFPFCLFTEPFIQSSFIIFKVCVSHWQYIKQKRQSRVLSFYTLWRTPGSKLGYMLTLFCCACWCIFVCSFKITNACKLIDLTDFSASECCDIVWCLNYATCFWAKCE